MPKLIPTQPIKDDVIAAITQNLREFGYTNLSEATVREQVNKLLVGEEVGIIGQFARSMLLENKLALVEGEQPDA